MAASKVNRRQRASSSATPAIAQLVEHLTVDACSDQMVPGSIPGGRMLCHAVGLAVGNAAARPQATAHLMNAFHSETMWHRPGCPHLRNDVGACCLFGSVCPAGQTHCPPFGRLPRRFAGALQLYARDSVAQKRSPQPGVGRAMHLMPTRSCGYGTSNGTV